MTGHHCNWRCYPGYCIDPYPEPVSHTTPDSGRDDPMYHPTSATSPTGLIRATVLVPAPLPMYRRADGRMFVPVVPGNAYTLLVNNLSAFRVEVITTVDGRHVLRPEPGDPRACRGQVIAPNDSYEFKGWRVNDSDTDEFLFGVPADSVAAQATGSTSNVGVLGFAAWREYERYPHFDYADVAVAAAVSSPVMRGSTAKGMTTMGGGSVGTGIGARQHDPVGRTEFNRTGQPDILVIGYDTEAELARRGILAPPDADPFPGADTGYGAFRHAR